jgi:hypothetical protein
MVEIACDELLLSFVWLSFHGYKLWSNIVLYLVIQEVHELHVCGGV